MTPAVLLSLISLLPALPTHALGRAASHTPDMLEAAWSQAEAQAEAQAVRAAQEELAEFLRSFRLVSPGIYRSGRPGFRAMPILRKKGIKTILCLEDPAIAELDRVEAAPYGISVVNVPMSGTSEPSFAQVDAALSILSDSFGRPILVHCWYGRDRTGLVVAAYRVIFEGVSPAAAAKEAESYGCCHGVSHDLLAFLIRYQKHRADLAAR